MRGDVVDKKETVSYVIVVDGDIVASGGDNEIMRKVSIRSTGKIPMAVGLIHSGAADFFEFEPKHIAVVTASHLGGRDSIQAAGEILGKINKKMGFGLVNSNNLKNTLTDNKKRKRDAEEKMNHWCSGQHAGLLAACVFHELSAWMESERSGKSRSGDSPDADRSSTLDTFIRGKKTSEKSKRLKPVIDSYTDYTNDTHKYTRDLMSETLKCDVAYVRDGCNSGSLTMALGDVAKVYDRLAGKGDENSSSKGIANVNDAFARIRKAIREYPKLIHGPGAYDTVISSTGTLNSKWGVDGVHCLGFQATESRNAGAIVIKANAGNQSMAFATATQMMIRLGLWDSKDLQDAPFAEIHDGFHSAPVSTKFTVARNRGPGDGKISWDATTLEFDEDEFAFIKNVNDRIYGRSSEQERPPLHNTELRPFNRTDNLSMRPAAVQSESSATPVENTKAPKLGTLMNILGHRKSTGFEKTTPGAQRR